jgi:hypothetical protein
MTSTDELIALRQAAKMMADALRSGDTLIRSDLVGIEWKKGCRAFGEATRTALAAYEATK